MTAPPTAPPLMLAEALEAPQRIAHQLAANAALMRELGARLRRAPPAFAMTVARGSSDNAGTYARYLFETLLGVVTGSAAPSVVTAYGARLRMTGALALGISQSGQSPDLLAVMAAARDGGALTAALVNDPDSPLARGVEYCVALHAGPERAVAATKSWLASLAALAQLAAAWSQDQALEAALAALPERLAAATALDTAVAEAALHDAAQALVVARGRTLPVAQEVALKLKETSGIQGEPFSAAELRHGPVAIVAPGFPILALAIADPTQADVLATAADLAAKGARVILAAPTPEAHLRLPPPLHPVLDPIVAAQACYPLLARLAVARGYDPDRPRFLNKVTRTV